MEPIGSISRQAKDPEAKIETWFNKARLEQFAASFERLRGLWHDQHIDCDGVEPRSAEYLCLLESLGEPCAGEPRARVLCAKALCRVFCRLLRQKLRWAATTSLLDGTGEERALGMLPYWARQAERYMRYLPLVYLNTEQELKTKAERTARAQRAKKKRAQGSRPPVPAPKHKPSQNAGRLLMQRVACGMRHAAKVHGLGRKAAAVVARVIGNQEAQVHALWSSMRVLAKAKLKALLARGDGRAQTVTAHLSSLDWAVADLLMMHELSPVQESSFDEYKQQLALVATFHLVQRFELETLEQEPPPHRWHEAARWYCSTGSVMSPVGLQRRWHALKEHTRRALRAASAPAPAPASAPASAPARPLHHLIAKKYPHVVTGSLRPWGELLAAGLVAKPTNERSSKKRQNTAANKSTHTIHTAENTEKDNAPVIHDVETNTLAGDKAEVSGERRRDPSRPGPSKSVTRIIDHSPLRATSGSEVSSEENSNHVHTHEVENRHYENTRGESYQKNIDINKEIIDLNATRAESEESKRLQRLDDRSASNTDTEVVKEGKDFKDNVDVKREIIDMDFPSAESEELKRFQGLDARSASNIDTEVVKEEDFKSNVDVNKEIIDLDAPNTESEESKRLQSLDHRSALNVDSEVVKEKDHKNNVHVNKEIIDLYAPSAESDKLKSQGLDDSNAFNIVKEVVKGGTASKANSLPNSDDIATQVIRAIEPELFCDRVINRSSECTSEANSNIVQTNEVKIRLNENNRGEDYKKNIDVNNKEVIDLDAPSAESNELKRGRVLDDRNASNRVKEVVEGRITSKANNTPNSDDFAKQVVRGIEKEIFYKGSSKSKNYECNTTQNCANVSNSKMQPSSKEINNDGIETVTSSSQINTNESNSSVADAVHKHPMLSQMLQTECIFDDDAELNAFLNKNKEVYRKGNSSNIDVPLNTNVHENKIESLVENKTRKRVRAKLTDDWAQDIVKAIKRQRLESAKLENFQINNLIEKEPSRGNVDKSNKKHESRSSVSAMSGKTKSKDTENSKSDTNLDSDDELYFFNVNSDEEDTSQDSGVREDDIDPKLLMYPVVVMTRIENDPALRIVSKLPPLPTSRSPSPNLSNLVLESPSLPDIKLEKLDDGDSGAEDTPLSVNVPMPEILNEKTRALLKLCKPCEVLLDRLEEVDKGIGRLAKRVELQDIDEVRRNNRRVLTAQVAPLSQDSESSSSDSRDSDWTPDIDTTPKRTSNKNSDSDTDDNDDENDNGDDDDNGDDEIIKPTNVKDLKNPDDHLKQLLNDFVDGPADAECCRRNKRTQLRGELAATASLAMKRNCARCLWRLLSLPPSSASEAHLQRRLLRHTVLQATATAPKVTEIPKQISSGPKQILNGTKQIPSGTKQIPSGTKHIRNGTKQIPSETKHIRNGTKQIPSGTKHIRNGTKQIPSGTKHIRNGTKQIPSETKQIPSGTKQIPSGTKQIPSGTKQIPSGTKHIRNGTKQIPSETKQIPSGTKQIPSGTKQIPSGTKQIPSGTKQIPSGTKQIPSGTKQIPSGTKQIPSGTKQIPSGTKQIPSGTKQIPKQISSSRSKKKSLPATPASQPVTNAAPAKQYQRIASAADRPLPASQPRRTDTVKQAKLAPQEPADSTVPKNPERRSSASLFRPGAVADINEKLCKLAENQPPPAPGAFEPVITSVLSLAPPQPKNKKCPLVLKTVKLLQSNLAPTARDVVEKPPATNVRQTGSVATLNVPKPSLNYVAIPSNRAQRHFNTLQPCNAAQSYNSQSAQFERDPTQCLNMSNVLQPPINLPTPQHLPGTTNLHPVVQTQTVVGQMGSQNFALQGTTTVMFEPNTVAGNVMQAPGFQNAPWNNQENCVVKQETSAFPPVMPANANQPNPMYIQSNQPNPIYTQPNQANPMYIQSNQPNPIYIQPNQPNPMSIQPNQPNPMYIQQNQSNPMQINQNQPNLMYIQPNQPNPIKINQNQPNPMQINQNQPWNNQGNCLVKQETSAVQPVMPINANQPNPMYTQPNQPNPIYMNPNQPNPICINPNQPELMNIQPNQPNLIRPSPMYINPNQSNAMHTNPNQPNSIYPNQMYVNPNQPNPMQYNPNQPYPMHVNPNQSNPMYIDQNQLNLMNATQINQPIICPGLMSIKPEQGSSYLSPVSHPNPYGTDPGYSPTVTVPLLGNSTLTGISQPNAFNPMNAGSLQTLFNSTQEPSQPQSFQRPPSYGEAVAVVAGSQQGSLQVDHKQGPSQCEDLKPTMLAVDVKMYDKINTFARMEWSGRALPSHSWAVAAGRAVLCTGAGRSPWALLGRFLVLSEDEPAPPSFDVWALNPRVRLLLPLEKEESPTDASAAKPARLQVKSFARSGPEPGRPRRRARAKVKLSDNPLVYAKLLVSVPNANACRQLLKRGGALQLYCMETCLLHPVLSQPTGRDSQFSLSGEAAVFPALQELARQLQDL